MKCLITWGDLSCPWLFFKWLLTTLLCGLDAGLAFESESGLPGPGHWRAERSMAQGEGRLSQRPVAQLPERPWAAGALAASPSGLPGQCCPSAVPKGVPWLCLLPCVRGAGGGNGRRGWRWLPLCRPSQLFPRSLSYSAGTAPGSHCVCGRRWWAVGCHSLEVVPFCMAWAHTWLSSCQEHSWLQLGSGRWEAQGPPGSPPLGSVVGPWAPLGQGERLFCNEGQQHTCSETPGPGRSTGGPRPRPGQMQT